MRIKALKNLPERAKQMYDGVYNSIKDSYSPITAAKIALNVVSNNYQPVRAGKKSMAISQPTSVAADNYIDVLLGHPGMDNQAKLGGLKLHDSGWSRIPQGVLKGDMEHYYSDKAEGLYVDLDEAWEGWVPVAQKFWSDDLGLHARVELPENHTQTPNFIKKWSSGEYGLSIEYAYPEEAVEYNWYDEVLVPEVKEWHITGFTFTEDPSYTKTKNGR